MTLDRIAELGNPFDNEDREWRPVSPNSISDSRLSTLLFDLADEIGADRAGFMRRLAKFLRPTDDRGDLIRELRRGGMSASQIAKQVGVSKSAIQQRLRATGMGGSISKGGRRPQGPTRT